MQTAKNSLANVVSHYQRYLKLERGYSPNTVEAYMRDLQKLFAFLSDVGITPAEARFTHLEQFAATLSDLGVGATSVKRILSGVRSFYRYLLLDGYIDVDPTELLESPKTGLYLPEVLSTAEVDAMEGSIDLSKPEGQRNKTIIEVLFSCAG